MARQLSLFDFFPSFQPFTKSTEKAEAEHKIKTPSLTDKKSEQPLPSTYAKTLVNYLPGGSIDPICGILAKYKVYLRITRHRYTKLGDYRSPRKDRKGVQISGHQISINHDLNRFSFLITLVHEIAHLTTWEKHKKAKPHGPEWKQEFREQMSPFIEKKVFPAEVAEALNNYLRNPAALNCTDTALLKALRKYDKKAESEKIYHLEEIPENAVFTLTGSKKLLKKGKRLRKRYLCSQVGSKRRYLVSPVAEIIIIKKQ